MKRITPADLTDAEKNYTWNSIAPHLHAQATKSPLFASLWRKVTAFVLVATLVMGGGLATASAHYDVVPGDFLFPVEIATEKVQIFLAGNSSSKESLRIKFAEKRLVEVKALIHASELAALTHATSGTGATSTTQTTGTTTVVSSPATTTLYLSKDAVKQIARTERAIVIALEELEETRSTLASSGSQSGVFIIEDIIEELRGAGDGSVTITKIAAKGNSGKVSIKATFTPTGTATTTGSFSGTVNIEETKRGAKITLNDSVVKTSISVRATNTPQQTGGKHGDDDEDEDHDGDGKHEDKSKEDKKGKGGKKTKICHRADGSRHTIEISIAAARAHLAHGDSLGACQGSGGTGTSTPDTTSPVITELRAQAGTTTVTLSWKTNEAARGYIYLGTVSPVVTTAPNTTLSDLALTRTITLAGLSTSTTYHYLVSVSDAAGNRATSSQGSFTTGSGIITPLPDTTAPAIDAITFTPNTTGAALTWTTSESAKTKVWVSATNSPDTTLAPTQEESAFASSHSMSLTGLSPATQYRVILSATDASGNRATSTERTFTTVALPPPADVTAPVVTNVEKTVATTTALITWNTNEPSGSALYFSTGDPLNGTVLTNSTLLFAHDAALSGLTGSTTYRFIIVAKDSASNTATTSESTFTTL